MLGNTIGNELPFLRDLSLLHDLESIVPLAFDSLVPLSANLFASDGYQQLRV